MANEIELNIVVLPDEKTKDIAIDLSRKLSEKFQTNFVLDGKKIHPHMTIYQARYPEKNLDTIRAYLKNIAGRTAPFEVVLGKFSRWRNFVFWDTENTNEIVHLQKSIIYQLNPLREGLIPKGLQNGKWDMTETYQIQNYGTLLPGSSVAPFHITISNLKQEASVPTALQEMNPRVTKFIVTKIALGILGEYGTVTEILEEFPFGGQSPYMLRPQNYF